MRKIKNSLIIKKSIIKGQLVKSVILILKILKFMNKVINILEIQINYYHSHYQNLKRNYVHFVIKAF